MTEHRTVLKNYGKEVEHLNLNLNPKRDWPIAVNDPKRDWPITVNVCWCSKNRIALSSLCHIYKFR